MEATTITTHVYVAKSTNLRLTLRAGHEKRDPTGNRYAIDEGAHVEFADHRFTADEESAAKLGVTLPELIDFMSNHEDRNLRFWDEGAPPEAQSPSIKEQNARVLRAMSDHDADEIGRVIEEEREGYNRSAVIGTATAALEQLSEG